MSGWQDDALCKNYNADLWFADAKVLRNIATRICGECPVSAPCLAGAIERKERYGIWAGRDFGAAERRRKYRQKQSAA